MKLFYKILFEIFFFLAKRERKFKKHFFAVISSRISLLIIQNYPELSFDEVLDLTLLLNEIILDDKKTYHLNAKHTFLLDLIFKDKEIQQARVSIKYLDYFIFQTIEKPYPEIVSKFKFEAEKLAEKLQIQFEFEDLKSIKKNKKNLIKTASEARATIKSHFDNKIEEKKLSLFGNLNLSIGEAVSFFTLISAVFLFSGFFYPSYILSSFNVNSGDFYSISDYFATSPNLLGSIIYSVLLTAAFFFGLKSSWDRHLHSEVYSYKKKESNHHTYLIVFTVFVINFSTLSASKYNDDFSFLISMNLFILVLLGIEKIPFKYFKKPELVLASSILLSTMSISVFYDTSKQNAKI